MKIEHNSGPGLVIGLPTLGRPVPLDWAFAFKSLNAPANFNTVFQVVKGQEIGFARQAIAEFAVEKGAKYLFFLGDDVVTPPHTLKQLIYRMEQDPTIDVVGGVYCTKCEVPNPLVYRGNGQGCYWDWKVGEFFEVTGMGMDCTLIRVSAFKDLPKPWFKTVDKDKFLDGIPAAEQWTEDLFFFDKMGKAGKRSFVDASVICEHWDVYSNKKYGLPIGSLPNRVIGTTKSKKCLILGDSMKFAINPAEADEFEVVRAGNTENNDYRVQWQNLPFAENEFDWVIVPDPGMELDVTEWLRVTKTKLSILYPAILQREMILIAIPGSKIQGQFIEVEKNVPLT
jgi:hypothetical protein